MKWVHSALIAVFISSAALALSAQTQTRTDETSDKPIPTKNPLEGNADAIRAGMGQFRSRCADCHGMDARGVRAPDLTQVWAQAHSRGSALLAMPDDRTPGHSSLQSSQGECVQVQQ